MYKLWNAVLSAMKAKSCVSLLHVSDAHNLVKFVYMYNSLYIHALCIHVLSRNIEGSM